MTNPEAMEQMHSPLPWALKQDARWPFELAIEAANGDTLIIDRRMAYSTEQRSLEAVMSGRHMGNESERAAAVKANIEQIERLNLIVEAVNSYATLRDENAALREALEVLVLTDDNARACKEHGYDEGSQMWQCWEAARAALKGTT